MLFEYTLSARREDFYNITSQVHEAVVKSGVSDGIAVVYCPHTTAGITINENADPDVARDMLFGLDKAFPDRAEFRHAEGNSAAHLKASAVGLSATIFIEWDLVGCVLLRVRPAKESEILCEGNGRVKFKFASIDCWKKVQRLGVCKTVQVLTICLGMVHFINRWLLCQ